MEGKMNKYDYEFSVWPHEAAFGKAVFDLFRQLTTRIVMTFTANEFEMFRDQIGVHGFTLREISRTPHQEPELIL
jgi:hypothetical protein